MISGKSISAITSRARVTTSTFSCTSSVTSRWRIISTSSAGSSWSRYGVQIVPHLDAIDLASASDVVQPGRRLQQPGDQRWPERNLDHRPSEKPEWSADRRDRAPCLHSHAEGDIHRQQGGLARRCGDHTVASPRRRDLPPHPRRMKPRSRGHRHLRAQRSPSTRDAAVSGHRTGGRGSIELTAHPDPVRRKRSLGCSPAVLVRRSLVQCPLRPLPATGEGAHEPDRCTGALGHAFLFETFAGRVARSEAALHAGPRGLGGTPSPGRRSSTVLLAIGPVVLVAAPAGFGKTTLLTQWTSRVHRATAWVTLDPGDDDPVRLWTYVAAALERAGCPLGTRHGRLLSRRTPARSRPGSCPGCSRRWRRCRRMSSSCSTTFTSCVSRLATTRWGSSSSTSRLTAMS